MEILSGSTFWENNKDVSQKILRVELLYDPVTPFLTSTLTVPNLYSVNIIGLLLFIVELFTIINK